MIIYFFDRFLDSRVANIGFFFTTARALCPLKNVLTKTLVPIIVFRGGV